MSRPLSPEAEAEKLDGMAETAASGASLFGPLPFLAACLREEAEYVRQHGPIPSSYDPREASR